MCNDYYTSLLDELEVQKREDEEYQREQERFDFSSDPDFDIKLKDNELLRV